jgi:glutaminyl-tRNA synthetase
VDYAFLEHCLREDLNINARRTMAVLNPVKLILTNYPEGKTEYFDVENNPEKPEEGTRRVSFSRELWIEREDFMEVPAKKYFRMFAGNEVRLKTAYVVKCTGCEKDKDGTISAVYAEYDPQTRGGNTPDGRKVKSTIHWVDAKTAIDAEVRLYGRLFTVSDPEAGDYINELNPDSLKVLNGSKVEPWLAHAKKGESFQFMRQGYFCTDSHDFTPEHLVFNRSVSLKDSFKKKK